MPLPRVLVTRRILDAGMTALEQSGAVQVDCWEQDGPMTREALLQRVPGVVGILSMLSDRIDAAVLDAAGPSLRIVSNYAVGLDNIDVAEASRRGIYVGHTPGVLTDATADLAFALMLAAARRLPEGERYVRAGQWKTWSPTLMLGQNVGGATLGIVGFGRIGKAVARRAQGFGMRVLFSTRTVPSDTEGATPVELDTLFRESDFISLHTPGTPETRHLINPRTLGLMKPNAILVNTGRGSLVDQQALYDALKSHRIFAAALDVTDPEPLPADHPLLTLDNCLVIPHVGSATVATRSTMAVIAAENLLHGARGEAPRLCANPQITARR